jgi:ubiquinone/menaquinone biosynthesis C-methylase UbiE
VTLSAESRAAYDAAAASYDAFVPGAEAELPLHRALLDAFTELTAASGGRRVLDAGCGTGRLVPLLQAAHLEVVGADASPGMVAVARRENPGIPFSVAQLGALPFDDASFAGVLAWYSLIHTAPEDLPATLTEVARVLRPGGLFLTGFQVGQGTRTATGYYLGEHRVTAHLFTTDQVSDVLGDVGLEVLATCTTSPGEARYPQGFVLARRLPDAGVDDG